jgi:hypothetical protein
MYYPCICLNFRSGWSVVPTESEASRLETTCSNAFHRHRSLQASTGIVQINRLRRTPTFFSTHYSRPLHPTLHSFSSWIYTQLFSFPLWLYSPLDLGRFFSFLILYTVGRSPWTGHQPVARPLPTHNTNRINAHRHTCLEWDSNPSQCSSERRRFMP